MSEPVAKQRPMIDLDEFERRLRRPPSQGRTAEDPLAELARLVGGEEDPFKRVFEHQPKSAPPPELAKGDRWQPREPTVEPPGSDHPLAGNFAAIEAGLRGSMQPEAHRFAEAPAPSVHQPSMHQQSMHHDDVGEHPGYVEPAWHDGAEPAPAALQSQYAGRSRRPLYLMAAVIILGVAGIGASFAYKGRTASPREIATIKAEPGPTKIQPDSPGGVEVANQDASILDKSPQVETVAAVDHQEQPVDLSQVHETNPRMVSLDSTPMTAAPPQGAASVPVPPTPSQMQQPLSIAALIEPKKVKTVSVRPDGTLLPNDTPPQVGSPPVPPSHANAATPAVARPSTPKSTTRVVTTPKPVWSADHENPNAPMQLAGAAKPKPAAAAAAKPVQVAETEADDAQAATPAATQGGGFAVQLAAPPSEKEAREASARIQKKFAAELAGHHPSIRKATVADKDIYRVRVGGLSREEATGLCQKLQAGGGNCFVAKN